MALYAYYLSGTGRMGGANVKKNDNSNITTTLLNIYIYIYMHIYAIKDSFKYFKSSMLNFLSLLFFSVDSDKKLYF